jgi:hypothetical protein
VLASSGRMHRCGIDCRLEQSEADTRA